MSDTQQQLTAAKAAIEKEGYSFMVQPNYQKTGDEWVIKHGKGKSELYVSLPPMVTHWADLHGDGTLGKALPKGGEINESGAKFTLTVVKGGEALDGMVTDPADAAALRECQDWVCDYLKGIETEFWTKVWAKPMDDEIAKLKADTLKFTKGVTARAKKVDVSAVLDADVDEVACQSFIDNALSPFYLDKEGALQLRASQKVFKGTGEKRRPPKIIDAEGLQLNDADTDTPQIMRGMLVVPRIRLGAWAFAGKYGIRADLVKVQLLHEGDGGAPSSDAPKRGRDDDAFSAFAKKAKVW